MALIDLNNGMIFCSQPWLVMSVWLMEISAHGSCSIPVGRSTRIMLAGMQLSTSVVQFGKDINRSSLAIHMPRSAEDRASDLTAGIPISPLSGYL